MMKRMQVRVPRADIVRLDRWARKHGWSRSQTARFAIRTLVRKPLTDPLLELSGCLDDDMPPDVSENVDRYLNATYEHV